MNPLLMTDFYKIDHRRQYPEGTNLVYSNFTPRSGKHYSGKSEGIVFFGLQYFLIKFLFDDFNNYFFNKDIDRVIDEYKSIIEHGLGKDVIDFKHIRDLHELGYLPLRIKALPEGSFVPFNVPCLTIVNTKPEFFWLVNYIETALSADLWKICTKATIAHDFKNILKGHAKSQADLDFIPFQAHDFSFRGMSGCEDAMVSGMAHLTSFVGTDTIPSIMSIMQYYGGNLDNELIACSVPATEHSCMCMGTKEGELETYRRLLIDVYPRGIVSIVSDTWDLWNVIDNHLVALKEVILAREGKLVIRPDSGDPEEIICGRPYHVEHDDIGPFDGALERLWNIFGGTVEDGLKVLDSHIGLIYGDSITQECAESILNRMKMMGFSSRNIVFGVGSFTYQYITRDTMGFAFKSTYGEVNGEAREIFKDPITDNHNKKSAKGLLMVENKNGDLILHQECSKEKEEMGELKTVFEDGLLIRLRSIGEIRGRINEI